jgi:ribosome-binding protein aMBF1 (putative translation factor)
VGVEHAVRRGLVRRTTNVDAEIGQRVREHRIAKGISQTELGRATGVTFQQVQKYQSGTNVSIRCRPRGGRLSDVSA